MYLYIGFGNVSKIINFGIYFLFKNNSRKYLKSYLSHEKSQKIPRKFLVADMNLMIKIKCLEFMKI
jgi:hypothetical protein